MEINKGWQLFNQLFSERSLHSLTKIIFSVFFLSCNSRIEPYGEASLPFAPTLGHD